MEAATDLFFILKEVLGLMISDFSGSKVFGEGCFSLGSIISFEG
jgi:hypothetical protein